MQGADVRHAEILDGPQAGDTRETIVADQPSGFGEFGGGAFALACQGIGRGEVCANVPYYWIGVARLFEPNDRFVDARS